MAGASTGTIIYQGQEIPLAEYYRRVEGERTGRVLPSGQEQTQFQQVTLPSGQLAQGPRTLQTPGELPANASLVSQPQQTTFPPPSRSTAASSSAASTAKQGVSEDELRRIRAAVGIGDQPTVSRGNIAGEQEARQAAFARAKEQSAQIARSSLTGLRNALSRRGITGGGYADLRTAEALAPAADQLQDFTREQLIQDLGKSERGADLEYQGQIAQRGQNQASVNALLSLINSRGGLLY